VTETILLSDRAADRDVLAPACRIVETLIRLHGLAIGGWSMIGARGDAPALPVLDLNRHAEPIEDQYPLMDLPEDVEVSQYWIVSEWLARRLVENGEAVLLVCDDTYVWARLGCGYAIADDLRFLDEPDDEADPTEDDHARVIDKTGGAS